MCIEKTPWEQVIDFHGHTCPEIALGYRVGQIALRELGIRPSPTSELMVTAYTHSCALDALQILNRATFGRGALKVIEKQQHTYLFQYPGTAEGLQISLQADILGHLVRDQTHLTTREKQNLDLETIQVILGSTETQFCTIQNIQIPPS